MYRAEKDRLCDTSPILRRNHSVRLAQLCNLSGQHQKQSNSARLPQFLNLTTTKMKYFLKTSSKQIDGDNIKNDAILGYFLQKSKVQCQAAAVTQNHLSKAQDLMLKNATPSPSQESSAPDLRASLIKISLVLRLPREMHIRGSSANVPCLPRFETATKPSRFDHFWVGAESIAPATNNDA